MVHFTHKSSNFAGIVQIESFKISSDNFRYKNFTPLYTRNKQQNNIEKHGTWKYRQISKFPGPTLYRHKTRWWTSSPSHCGCAWPLPSSISTGMGRTTTARGQVLRHRGAHGELAVRNELAILMATAVAVADTSAVAAQSMSTYGSTWSSEVELWVVCSITTAALACETPAGRAQGAYFS